MNKAILATLLCCLPLFAQSEEDIRTYRERRQREQIEREIREKRDAMREGRVIRAHAAVRVKLKNGSKLAGVVKNERLVELPDSLDFVKAEIDAPGAGLRIWYYDNTNSYIFLRYEDIQSYRIDGRLTEVEIRAIETRIEEARKSAEQQRQEQIQRARAGAEGETPKEDPAAIQKAAEDKERLAAEDQLLQLLTEFPPEQGWGESRARQIEARKITVGVYPDPKSKRFLDIFSDWQKALAIRERRAAEAAEKEQTPPPPPQPPQEHVPAKPAFPQQGKGAGG